MNFSSPPPDSEDDGDHFSLLTNTPSTSTVVTVAQVSPLATPTVATTAAPPTYQLPSTAAGALSRYMHTEAHLGIDYKNIQIQR